MLRNGRRKYFERIKATNSFHDTGRMIKSFEDYIDTENVTKWVYEYLKNNTDYDITLKANSSYLPDEKSWDSVDVENCIVISLNTSSIFNKEKLSFYCCDNVLTIRSDELGLFRGGSYISAASWYYENINKKDAVDIAKYIIDCLNSSLKRYDLPSLSTKPRKGETALLDGIVNKVEEYANLSVTKLPRGKQRSLVKIESSGGKSKTVYVLYRENSTSPYNTICSFDVIQNKDSVDLFCSTGDYSKAVDSIVIVDAEKEDLDIKGFVDENIINQFDEFWNNKR